MLSFDRLALDDGDRPELDALLADACLVASVYHIAHVLVGLGRLLHDELRRQARHQMRSR